MSETKSGLWIKFDDVEAAEKALADSPFYADLTLGNSLFFPEDDNLDALEKELVEFFNKQGISYGSIESQ